MRVALALLLALAGPSVAQQRSPCADRVARLADVARYPAYRVAVRRVARPARPVFRSPDTRVFRTAVRTQLRDGPNFAGRLRLVEIGCGAGATCLLVADTVTGRVTYSPAAHIVEEDLDLLPTERTNFRAESRLLVLAGFVNEVPERRGLHFLAWERGALRPVRFVPMERVCAAS